MSLSVFLLHGQLQPPHHPHDKGYGQLLSDKRVSLELLKTIVREEWVEAIEADDLILVNKSYVLPASIQAKVDCILDANNPLEVEQMISNLEIALDEMKQEILSQGKLEGKLEGELKGKREVARNLLLLNIDIDTIIAFCFLFVQQGPGKKTGILYIPCRPGATFAPAFFFPDSNSTKISTRCGSNCFSAHLLSSSKASSCASARR
ncbi:hypothetical protein E308F_25210 [Moorella sp. E308F]|nr:hypothetical protein E308F_25210 [Moorella sp. E308F]GEA17555.1 hypothetical protein E306M_06890 [Moorella sp. E306M]